MALDKLVDSTKLDNALTYEAGKIRAKLESQSDLTFDFANEKGFGDYIEQISGGGGDTLTFTSLAGRVISAFTGRLSGKNLIIDMKNKGASIPNVSYFRMDETGGTFQIKNVWSGSSPSNMRGGDLFRQAVVFKEYDLGGIAPDTMTRWFYQATSTVDGSPAVTPPITVRNVGLGNLSSNNNSFVGVGGFTRTTEVYFSGELVSSINLSGWTMLSADSWNRLIECLHDYSGNTTAHTLTVGSTILAMIDATHQAMAAARGWTLA